jgi:protein tyrosine/serine phosphatase
LTSEPAYKTSTGPDPVGEADADVEAAAGADVVPGLLVVLDEPEELHPAAKSATHTNPAAAAVRGLPPARQARSGPREIIICRPYQLVVTGRLASCRTVITRRDQLPTRESGRGGAPEPVPGSRVYRPVCDGVVMAWIELEGAVNVRDLGGLPTEDGQKTVRARLLRADNLQELSAADIAKLVRDIGVTTVVDLRSSNELAAEGPAPLDAVAGVRHVHHPVVPEVGSNTDMVADALLTRQRQDKSRYPRDPVCGHYLGYLEDRPDQVVGALRTIAHAEGAALVHCAAGKDRTGVVVALALTVAGVPAEAVAADYAASGERTEAVMARLRRSRLYAGDIDSKPADLHRPRAETMTAFLEQMDARYGGVARWLADHGLSAADLRTLRVKLRSAA